MWEPGEHETIKAAALSRKKPGTLFLTNKRLAWVPQGGLAPTVIVKHDDIKVQLVNAAGSEKVILKVNEVRPEFSHSFIFTSEVALKERDNFKDAILAILTLRQRNVVAAAANANASVNTVNGGGSTGSATSSASTPAKGTVSNPATPKLGGGSSGPGTPILGSSNLGNRGMNAPSGDLKTRFNLLSQNAELRRLHKELVGGKHVTEEEFWESRKQLLRNKAAIDQQRKGQSSAWLDLKPETGESSDVKYIMTPQIIYSICQQYPSIRRAYDLYVPDKLSEGDFWRRYFSSRFFHRNRSGRGANEPDDDIFDRALQEDEDETKHVPKKMRLDIINPLLDLSRTEEDHLENYTCPDSTMAAGNTKESREALPLTRRFNRYSERVLNSTVGPKKQGEVVVGGTGEGMNMNGVERAIVMEDLNEQKDASKVVLDIQDTWRYFESQGREVQRDSGLDNQRPEDTLSHLYTQFVRRPVDLNKPFMFPNTAFGILMKNVKANRAKMMPPKDGSQILPKELFQEALSCHSAGNEILRHFWASTGFDKAAKNARMVESLKKIREENIRALMIQASSHSSEGVEAMKAMFRPLQNSIAKAIQHAEKKRPLVLKK